MTEIYSAKNDILKINFLSEKSDSKKKKLATRSSSQ